jgi:hypothetical protein
MEDEVVKKYFLEKWPTLAMVVVFIAVGVLFYATRETDPAFFVQETTFGGELAAGQLHRDGSYTFFHANRSRDGRLIVTSEIASFPAAEAAKLH